jgi:hypothetical protein
VVRNLQNRIPEDHSDVIGVFLSSMYYAYLRLHPGGFDMMYTTLPQLSVWGEDECSELVFLNVLKLQPKR